MDSDDRLLRNKNHSDCSDWPIMDDKCDNCSRILEMGRLFSIKCKSDVDIKEGRVVIDNCSCVIVIFVVIEVRGRGGMESHLDSAYWSPT
jgi:hypothetical protein